MPGSFLTSFEKPPAKIFLIPSAIKFRAAFKNRESTGSLLPASPFHLSGCQGILFFTRAFSSFLRRKSAFLFFFASCFLWPKMYTIKATEKFRRLHDGVSVFPTLFAYLGKFYYIRCSLSLWKEPPRGLYHFIGAGSYIAFHAKALLLRAAKFKCRSYVCNPYI